MVIKNREREEMEKVALLSSMVKPCVLSMSCSMHWIQVERNGLTLAAAEGGDPEVVSLFALFHDSNYEEKT